MLLSRCFKRKVVATCGAALGFSLLYEANVLDSRYAGQQAEPQGATNARPSPGHRFSFDATAYCKGDVTSAGTAARTGIAAADPALLPVGSVIQVDSLGSRYNGIYTVMDTGPAVQGRELDLYMWSCQEAQAFGRKEAGVTVLRLGWNPRATGSLFTGSRPARQLAPALPRTSFSPVSD
jgi:3D (Asp-Asp-Asp) domain-containing protein